MSGTLHNDLTGCIAADEINSLSQHFYATLNIVLSMPVKCSSNNTHNALLRFHCNKGYVNAPRCYVTCILSYLFSLSLCGDRKFQAYLVTGMGNSISPSWQLLHIAISPVAGIFKSLILAKSEGLLQALNRIHSAGQYIADIS